MVIADDGENDRLCAVWRSRVQRSACADVREKNERKKKTTLDCCCYDLVRETKKKSPKNGSTAVQGSKVSLGKCAQLATLIMLITLTGFTATAVQDVLTQILNIFNKLKENSHSRINIWTRNGGASPKRKQTNLYIMGSTNRSADTTRVHSFCAYPARHAMTSSQSSDSHWGTSDTVHSGKNFQNFG